MINPPIVRKVRLVHSHLAASHMCSLVSALLFTIAHAQIGPSELVAPKMEVSDGNLIFTIQPSMSGRNYQLQCSDSMAGGTWTDVGVLRSGDGGNITISTPYLAGVQKRFYRVTLAETTPAPAGFSLISAGSFQIGDALDGLTDAPVHSVTVSAFYLQNTEVTKAQWDVVANWAAANGYDINAAGGSGKAANHPVYYVTWYEVVKYCNARSQMENLTPCYTVGGVTYKTGSSAPDCDWNASGYRLPSEAEWEKAARGGLSGKRFPWGDTINHSNANYRANSSAYSYDTSGYTTYTYHPTYNDGVSPYTSPVGSFAPNEYGLYDMAGNLWEWCWDWYLSSYYSTSPGTDPRGPTSGSARVYRGGYWHSNARYCRTAFRGNGYFPTNSYHDLGFRPARSSVP